MLDNFPNNISTDDLVTSLYAQRSFINLEKDSLVLIQKDWLEQSKDTGFIYFFKAKPKNEDEWEYGYIGPIDSTDSELKRWNYEFEDDFGFNKFEDETLQLKMQLRQLQMQNRRRYRVTDEEEFKNLRSGRSRYLY